MEKIALITGASRGIGRATAQAIFSAVFMPIRLGTSSPKMSVR